MVLIAAVIIYYLYKSGQIKSKPLFKIARFILWFFGILFGFALLMMIFWPIYFAVTS